MLTENNMLTSKTLVSILLVLYFLIETLNNGFKWPLFIAILYMVITLLEIIKLY